MNFDICKQCLGNEMTILKINYSMKDSIIMLSVFPSSINTCLLCIKDNLIVEMSFTPSDEMPNKFSQGNLLDENPDEFFKKAFDDLNVDGIGIFKCRMFDGKTYSECPYRMEHNLYDWNSGGSK